MTVPDGKPPLRARDLVLLLLVWPALALGLGLAMGYVSESLAITLMFMIAAGAALPGIVGARRYGLRAKTIGLAFAGALVTVVYVVVAAYIVLVNCDCLS